MDKIGNACLIFPSRALLSLADQERVCIQASETFKIPEGIFQKQTLVSEGLLILVKYILAPEFFYQKQRHVFKLFLLTSQSHTTLKRTADMTFFNTRTYISILDW